MAYVKNKVALVTGGASGIGLVTTREFLKNGLRGVTIADLDAENGERAFKNLTEEFGLNRVLFIKTDVTHQEDIEAAFKVTIETFRNLDVVVNSAGICREDEWEKEVAININGTIHVSLLGLEKYLPIHKTGDEAIVINISSTAGLRGSQFLPVYAATKYAIIGFSKSLGTQNNYSRTKVRVLTICPGVTDTALLASIGDHLVGPSYKQLFAEAMTKYQAQRPEEVAKGIMRAIEEGKNGSVWLVHAGRMGEVKLPDSITLVED